jgi:hypothetical protein
MQAVAEHGATEWKTNLGLKPEPDDEGLYTETQVQKMRESFEQAVTDPENQPSQYGTVLMKEWQGLTEEEIKAFDTWHDNREEEVGWCNPSEIVAYIEAKLKEKNT